MLRPSWSRPPDEDQGAVTFCLIRSTSAAVVAASIQEVSAIAAATAAKQENQDPHAAVVTETISAAIVADDREEISLFNPQRNAVDGRLGSAGIGIYQVVDLNRVHFNGSLSFRCFF